MFKDVAEGLRSKDAQRIHTSLRRLYDERVTFDEVDRDAAGRIGAKVMTVRKDENGFASNRALALTLTEVCLAQAAAAGKKPSPL